LYSRIKNLVFSTMTLPKKNPEKSKKGNRRSLRGLFKGSSFSKRISRRAPEWKAAIETLKTPGLTQENGDNTCDRDSRFDQSLSDSKKNVPESALRTESLQLIMLVMDPTTLCFEFLQLEFDSQKAVVGDVLSEFPHSITQEVLRKLNYSGVCDRKGKEFPQSTCLGSVCKGSDIFIALPENLDAKECARLARRTLSDNNVIEMLLASGIDVRNFAETESEVPRSLTKLPSSGKTPRNVRSRPTSFTRGLFIAIFIILCAIAIQLVLIYGNVPLFGPGQSLSPHAFLSKYDYKALSFRIREFLIVRPRESSEVVIFNEEEILNKAVQVE